MASHCGPRFASHRVIFAEVADLLPLLAACHTVQGAGKDISAVGHGVSDAASH